MTRTTVREAGESEQRWFCGGGLHTWVATSAETGGAYLMFEDALELGKVTPLHLHAHADETFYILEGEILLHLDGEQRALHSGGIAIILRGVPHAFKATTPHTRMLCLQTPGGGEAFYRQASEPATPAQYPYQSTSTESAKRPMPPELSRSSAHHPSDPTEGTAGASHTLSPSPRLCTIPPPLALAVYPVSTAAVRMTSLRPLRLPLGCLADPRVVDSLQIG